MTGEIQIQAEGEDGGLEAVVFYYFAGRESTPALEFPVKCGYAATVSKDKARDKAMCSRSYLKTCYIIDKPDGTSRAGFPIIVISPFPASCRWSPWPPHTRTP